MDPNRPRVGRAPGQAAVRTAACHPMTATTATTPTTAIVHAPVMCKASVPRRPSSGGWSGERMPTGRSRGCLVEAETSAPCTATSPSPDATTPRTGRRKGRPATSQGELGVPTLGRGNHRRPAGASVRSSACPWPTSLLERRLASSDAGGVRVAGAVSAASSESVAERVHSLSRTEVPRRRQLGRMGGVQTTLVVG